MGRFIIICVSLALLGGCRAGPTLADAREKLHDGDPRQALSLARSAARDRTPLKDRLALHRVAFHASLSAGWSHEAAREYMSLRRLTGQEDPTLLRRLARSTLRLGLTSSDRARRVAAARALPLASEVEGAGDRLTRALSDPLPVVRATAVRGAAEAGPDLARLEAASQDSDPLVRRAALQALQGSLPRVEDGSGVVAIARASLNDPSPDVRLAGLDLCDALRRAGHDGGLEADLAQAVRNGSDAVCVRAVRSLIARSPAAALDAWRRADHRLRNLEPLGRALRLASEPGQRQAVLEDLRDPDHRVRWTSTQGLGHAGAAPLRGQLLRLVQRDPVPAVRLSALRALLGSDLREDALAAGLAQSDPAVRRFAFSERDAGTPWTMDQLEATLRSRDVALAHAVAERLSERGGARGVGLLLEGLSHPSTRLACAEALARSAAEDQREAFLGLLADGDPRLRAYAAAGLATTAVADDRSVLVSALLDTERHADLNAAAALLSLEARLAAAPAAGSQRLPD